MSSRRINQDLTRCFHSLIHNTKIYVTVSQHLDFEKYFTKPKQDITIDPLEVHDLYPAVLLTMTIDVVGMVGESYYKIVVNDVKYCSKIMLSTFNKWLYFAVAIYLRLNSLPELLTFDCNMV